MVNWWWLRYPVISVYCYCIGELGINWQWLHNGFPGRRSKEGELSNLFWYSEMLFFFSFTVCIDRINRMWVRAIYRNRQSRGEQKIIPELHDDPEKFHVYFRMSLPQFEELLSLVGPRIQKMTTTFRVPIPPRDRLAITLRWICYYVTINVNRLCVSCCSLYGLYCNKIVIA